jgi:hypothetical protein
MKEITGAKKVTIKRCCAGAKVRGQAKKDVFFCREKCFFSCLPAVFLEGQAF